MISTDTALGLFVWLLAILDWLIGLALWPAWVLS
jgi:hypothetical protein